MENEKKKANPDYTASAKDLSAPTATLEVYANWMDAKKKLELAEIEIESHIPSELIAARDAAAEVVDQALEVLKGAVELYGGFQNVEDGHYALQQRKHSKNYDAKKFADFYPDHAKIVIVPSVNVKALEGLIKGGLLKESDLVDQKIITTEKSYAFIIR